MDAAEMIDDLRVAPVLRGARRRSAVSESAITEALLAIGGENGLLLQLQDSVSEIDINPLIVSADGAFACDARLILAKEARGEAAA
jgi:acetate---CoA ligase (ADP-forming) subunit beta